MSKRANKSTASLRSATGGNKKSQHITKITAKSSRESAKRDAEFAKAEDAVIENVVTNTGKTEVQPIAKADQDLNAPDESQTTPKQLTRAEQKAKKAKQKADKKAAKLARKATHGKDTNGEERPIKSYFLLFRPFIMFGRYLRDSWREIRQVRWPNRKATWKMTLAVLVYVALFMVFLTLIDIFFTFVFDLLFKK